mmetsp:Transcript_13332/g.20566  ORF Transcript_13332/g.20566 Transcript_13332/m.20566 type:complete len:241 (-) Transcript_13332:161-883(-)
MLLKDVFEIHRNTVSKDNRVRDLHHSGFEMERSHKSLFFTGTQFFFEKGSQFLHTQTSSVDDLLVLELKTIFQNNLFSSIFLKNNFDGAISLENSGFFAAIKVTLRHGSNVCFGVLGPVSHADGEPVVHGILLNRASDSPVRVSFTKDRVNSTTSNFAVFFQDGLFFVILRVGRVVRQVVTLSLQFFNCQQQLRNRSGDVGKLDDVGAPLLGQFSQHGEGIGFSLFFCQSLRELSDDTRS